MRTQSLCYCFFSVLLSCTAAWAEVTPVGTAFVQGDVRDSKSQPVAGAELHVRAKDGTGFYRIVHTDARGHYAVGKLPNTDYEVILFFNGAMKASINNVKTFANKPAHADFTLKGQYAANKAKKHTHMVYVPAETGSNLGGHWVEVDDNSDIAAAAAGANNLTRAGNAAVRSLQPATVPHPNNAELGGQ